MVLFKKATDLHSYLEVQREKGSSVGFAPTMGALHEGHISLIQASRAKCDITVSSIFVNPTQFNDPKDFQKYPITLEKDIPMLEKAGCDVLFLPSVKEMYPEGITKLPHYDLGYLENILEGKYRPGHFQGVCAVVHRLLDMVRPNELFLGQKDYQQCMVIKKLIHLMHADERIHIHICPTLREPDGLAMSSRNLRLNPEERKKATAIYTSLVFVKNNITPGPTTGLKNKATALLQEKGFNVDYVEIADAGDLSIIEKWDGVQKYVVLAAAYLNEVRLIDNMVI